MIYIFLGVLAIFGNLASITYQTWNLVRPTGTPTAIAISNRILVLNLSMADLLVGVTIEIYQLGNHFGTFASFMQSIALRIGSTLLISQVVENLETFSGNIRMRENPCYSIERIVP